MVFSHGTLHRLNTERYVIGNSADRLLFIDLTLFHLWFLVGCRIKPNSTLKTRKQFFEPVLELNRTPRPVLVFFIDTRIIRYYYVLKIDKPYLYIRWIRVFFFTLHVHTSKHIMYEYFLNIFLRYMPRNSSLYIRRRRELVVSPPNTFLH
jgi:hypothetical protein